MMWPLMAEHTPMRIAVIGTSGAGKTTLSKRLAVVLDLPFIELDALHWEADWQALTHTNPMEFARRVDEATAGPCWIADGNYRLARAYTWERATHLIWLDYSRKLIMVRVVRRTLSRAILRTRMWSGNVERWTHLLRPSHPIRWAWRTWRQLQAEYAVLLASEEYAHLVVHRVRRPAELNEVIHALVVCRNGLNAAHLSRATGAAGERSVAGRG
jgi:adenylate kinase family enzyme